MKRNKQIFFGYERLFQVKRHKIRIIPTNL